MATKDALTSTSSKRPLGALGPGNEQFVQYRAAKINWSDIISVGTKKIFILPARSFVTRVWMVVITAVTSDGAAKVTVEESSGVATYIDATGGAKANLTAGSVIKGLAADSTAVLSAVAGHDDEYDTTERTIDVSTVTAALTAGNILLIAEFIQLDESAD